MAEPTVQVPVSLIHELVETVGSKGMPTDLYLRFDAFLPQPPPTAEPGLTERLAELRQPINGHRPYCLSNQPGDGPCNCDLATPPRIEDMAPGTTFTALTHGEGVQSRRTFTRLDDFEGGYFESQSGGPHFPRDIDPSTIRDVTPPPTTGADS